MDYGFSDLFSRVARQKRTDAVCTLIAMVTLLREGNGLPSTREIAGQIRLHQPAAMPANLTTTLRRLAPDVQLAKHAGGEIRWRVRQSGVEHVEELTGVDLTAGPSPAVLAYQLSDIHPRIRQAAEQLLVSGHLGEAIGRAAKALNRMVRDRTGRRSDSGTRMMHEVFSCESKPVTRLLLNSLEQEWEEDAQDGLRFLMVGVQQALANVDKHGELRIESPHEALEHLALLSLLARKVERAERKEPVTTASDAGI